LIGRLTVRLHVRISRIRRAAFAAFGPALALRLESANLPPDELASAAIRELDLDRDRVKADRPTR
jgi:hypothetical protein